MKLAWLLALAIGLGVAAPTSAVKLVTTNLWSGSSCNATGGAASTATWYAQDGACTNLGLVPGTSTAASALLNCTAGTLKYYTGTSACAATGALQTTQLNACTTVNPYIVPSTWACADNATTSVFSVLFFTDTKCTTLALPVVGAAGTCVPGAGGGYNKVTITGNTLTFQYYTDSACTMSSGTSATVTSGACVTPNPPVAGIGSQIIYAGTAWSAPSAAFSQARASTAAIAAVVVAVVASVVA